MEFKSVEDLHDKNDNSTTSEVEESKHPEIGIKDVSDPTPSSSGKNVQVNVVDWKVGENVARGTPIGYTDASGKVNMEASITPDDLIRAGGFGARDDINSFLPVASDFTDVEATISDARGYEEPQEETCRPGLGWREATETK